jgi:hypothetical protein
MLASPPTSSEIPDDKFDALLNLIQLVEAGEKNDLVRCWRGHQHQRKLQTVLLIPLFNTASPTSFVIANRGLPFVFNIAGSA